MARKENTPNNITTHSTPAAKAVTYDEVKKMHRFYFDIVHKRKWWFIFSSILIIVGVLSLFTRGLNLGIDYTGGTMFDMTFNKTVSQTEITKTLDSLGLEGHVQLTALPDGKTEALIRTAALEEEQRNALLTGLSTNVGEFDKSTLKEDKVGPAMGEELKANALLALGVAAILMLIYIAVRFQWIYAVSGVLALLHDILIVLGLFSLFQWQIDASFVAAILTVFGYSINDTVVIFDRIRENEGRMRRSDSYEEMVDKSVWQSMRRSINTVMTVLIALFALYFFGGESTKSFSLTMLIGVIFGAYSSIFIASQLVVELKLATKGPRKTESGAKA